jgi:hypothetical protein
MNSLTPSAMVRYAVLRRAQQLEHVMTPAFLAMIDERAASHSVPAGIGRPVVGSLSRRALEGRRR